jgi:release factor glutamine methyltransferase
MILTIHHSLCKFAGMTIQDAARQLNDELETIYEKGEAATISDWVIEHLTGLKKADRILHKNKIITHEKELQLSGYRKRLLQHEPVQYVLNEAWFCGLKFFVDKNVLIPRPETEELVEWIITNCKFPIDKLKILDIGSGSGCISIALKRKLRKADVWSCDVSQAALQVAKQNAGDLGVDINFFQLDFLNKELREQLPSFDIIVSNPPYVPYEDKNEMPANVWQHEPATALFVPDNDPLVFYKAISDFGKYHLNKNGTIYTEIHENQGGAVTQLFQSKDYLTELKKDMPGKERMLKAGYG